MAWQGLKLNLRVSQKQILTPGLVQMVSVLALNRLELREMINQEMIANPVLEELSEEPTQTDNYSDENFLKAERKRFRKSRTNPFDEFDVGSFNSIWIMVAMAENRRSGSLRATSLKIFIFADRFERTWRQLSVTFALSRLRSLRKASSEIWMRMVI